MRQTLMLGFQRTDIDLAAPVPRNLDGDMRGRAKPIETEPLTWLDSTQTQGSIADNSGAEEGGCFFIAEDRRDRIGKWSWDARIFCVTAINLITGKFGALTKVFSPGRAKFTDTARVLQPGNPNSLTDRPFSHASTNLTYSSDCLVAWNEGKRGVRQLTFDDMKIRPANSTDGDANQNLPRAWLRKWKVSNS